MIANMLRIKAQQARQIVIHWDSQKPDYDLNKFSEMQETFRTNQ
jgi:hypothetical protein